VSDLVLIQPEGQAWWKGGDVPTRTVECGGHRFQQIHISRLLQGVGKQYKNYKQLERSKEFLAEFSGSAGIPANVLVEEITDGPNELRGTWVHERIALHAAAWALVPLEVWLYGKLVAMFKGQEMVEAPSQPNAVVMLRAMADAIEQQDEKIARQDIKINVVKDAVEDIQKKLNKSDLQRVCEDFEIPMPWEWELAVPDRLDAMPGLYSMIDPETKSILYIGETKNLRNRLWVNRGKHEGLCFLWSKYYLYETRYHPAPDNEQQRRWIELSLTAAAKPRWQTAISQDAKRVQKQHRTSTPPLANRTPDLFGVA
jgi:hypothetical protein